MSTPTQALITDQMMRQNMGTMECLPWVRQRTPPPAQTSTSSGVRLKTRHSVIHQGDQEPCDGEAERLNVEEGLQ